MLNPVVAMLIGIVVMMVLIIFYQDARVPVADYFGDPDRGAGDAVRRGPSLTQCVSTVTTGFGNTMAYRRGNWLWLYHGHLSEKSGAASAWR